MKISVDEIPQTPKEISFSESVEDLKEFYRQSKSSDFGFPTQLDVELRFYRSGADLFFDGSFHAELEGCCGRCLETYAFELGQRFDFVLTPAPAHQGRRAEELRSDDLGLSYYSGEEIDLSPLIAEQLLLALPTRPLCKEDCRGLCSRCGANLNRESCDCAAPEGDPRMAIFRSLKVGR
jgi:uncharacterized protein